MENKFYTDEEFEHFLKDSTDNFRMYPSKKVWYSIYNDLHPSRRWPSLAVCLLLIFAILFIGVSNNNLINESKRAAAKNNFTLSDDDKLNDNKGSNIDTRAIALLGSGATPSSRMMATGNITASTDNIISMAEVSGPETTVNEQPDNNVLITGKRGLDVNIFSPSSSGNDAATNHPIASHKIFTDETGMATRDKDVPADNSTAIISASSKTLTPAELNKKMMLNKEMSAEDKAWIENFAYNNKASISKFKANAAIEYYVTPSVGFRFLKKNNDFEPASSQPLVSAGRTVSSLDINDEVTQKSAINMEAGVTLLYSIAKKIRLKGGIQLNYTSYISFADERKHSVQTALMYNTSNGGYSMEPRYSKYGNSINGDKNARLNNKTVQLSVPIGADFKLLGKSNLKWYAGATVQPSFTTGGQVYAISADAKNYVEQNDLLRKWNVSAGLETFLSYKTPAGISINAGPQLRYQLLSTYGKQYSYTEKLYNIGIKLGITKSF